MPQEGGIKGIYYSLLDKSWALAEWLEAKGIPMASFCDNRHINPLLLFCAILVAIVVLIFLVSGAFGGVSYGTLSVTVTSNSAPVDGARVYYSFGGEQIANTTNSLGKASLRFPKGQSIQVYASKEGYNQGVLPVTLTDDSESVSISMVQKVGNLRVVVELAPGMILPDSATVTIEAGPGTEKTNRVVNGQALFQNLPAGKRYSVYLLLGNQRPTGESATIVEGTTVESKISVPASALTVSLQLSVTDPSGQGITGVEAKLRNWDTTSIIDTQTVYGGQAAFNNVPMGSKVYVSIYSSDGRYSSYDGKASGYGIDVSRDGLVYSITLQIAGKVQVCAYDENGLPLAEGTATLADMNGVSQAYSTSLISGCADFYGIPEGARVYPVVTASGYQRSADPSSAKTVEYSGITSFRVTMRPLSENRQAGVLVSVTDCETGEGINGVKVKIVDAEFPPTTLKEGRTDRKTSSMPASALSDGNFFARGIESGLEIYAVAFDDDREMAQSGTKIAQSDTLLTIAMCEADEANVGSLEVCVYKDQNPYKKADVELYEAGEKKLMWVSKTDSGDDDNCHTFKNIPAGTNVYARAVNLGSSPEVSDVVAIEAGTVKQVMVYKGTRPVILKKGSIRVCAKNARTRTALISNVSIYDQLTNTRLAAGSTDSTGCRLFENIDAETNAGGQLIPKAIYVVVNSTGYGIYNSKESGANLTMVANGQLSIDVLLTEAFPICLRVRASDTGEPLKAKVFLFYNNSEDASAIEAKTTDADGYVSFSQERRDVYYFKVEETYTLYEPLSIYEFEREAVSGGACGEIKIYDLGSLCNLGAEVLDGGEDIRIVAGNRAKIPLRVLEDGDKAEVTIDQEGSLNSKHKIRFRDGSSANVTMTLNGKSKQSILILDFTEYDFDPEVIAQVDVDDPGIYNGVLQVTKNSMCSRQAFFTLDVYKEELLVSADSVSFNPAENAVSFCIYVKDQDGNPVKDASVSIAVDEIDGWASTASRPARYDEVKGCYKGALTSSVAAGMEPGTYTYSVMAKRASITKIAEFEATILSTTANCGNGRLDAGEACDPPARSCPSGQVCNSQCACEVSTAPLSVTAGKVAIYIGSGRSSGFCVNVYELNGTENKRAQVTARFRGDEWPVDTSRQASYDLSSGCYFISVSDSMAVPAGYRGAGRLIGTKTILITAVDGGRSGTTTTTATIRCGCDDESWCEPTCICDEDCEEGGFGSLDFFGCLQLMGRENLYPGATMNYPYYRQPYVGYDPYYNAYPVGYGYGTGYTGYGTPYSAGYGRTVVGGSGVAMPRTVVSPSRFVTSGSAGGLALDLERCRALFGDLGWWGSSYKGAVYVRDQIGLNWGSSEDDGSLCKAMQDMFKGSKDFKYFYVETPSGASTCCSRTYMFGITRDSAGSCDKQTFESAFETSLRQGDATFVDIIEADKDLKSKYGITDLQVIQGTNGKALYALGAGGLYGKGASFSVKGEKLPGQTGWSNADVRILGVVDSALAKSRITGDTLEDWFDDAGSGTRVGYPSGLSDVYKTIIVTDKSSVLSGLEGVILKGSEQGLKPSMFTQGEINEKTKIYVIADSGVKERNKNLAAIVEELDTNDYPKFEAVRGAMTYCDSGQAKDLRSLWSPSPVLLKANRNAYVVGVGQDEACSASGQKLKLELDEETARNIAYAKRISDNVFLLMVGEDAEDYASFVNQFKGFADSGLDSEIIYADDYGIIPAKKVQDQACNVVLGQRDTRLSAIANTIPKTNLPDADVQSHVLDCVYGGTPDNPPAAITGSVISDADFSASEIDIHLEYKDGATEHYAGNSDKFAISGSSGSFTFAIKNVRTDLDSGKYPLKIWATAEKHGSTIGASSAYYAGSDQVSVEKEKLASGGSTNIGTLELKKGYHNVKSTRKQYIFQITGTVVDGSSNPKNVIPNANVRLEWPGGTSMVTAGPNGRFDASITALDGVTLKLTPIAGNYPPGASREVLLDAETATGGFGGTTSGTTTIRDVLLPIAGIFNIGFSGKISECAGSGGAARPIEEGTVLVEGLAVGGAVASSAASPFYIGSSAGSDFKQLYPAAVAEGRYGVAMIVPSGSYKLKYAADKQADVWINSGCFGDGATFDLDANGRVTGSRIGSPRSEGNFIVYSLDLYAKPQKSARWQANIQCSTPSLTSVIATLPIQTFTFKATCWTRDSSGDIAPVSGDITSIFTAEDMPYSAQCQISPSGTTSEITCIQGIPITIKTKVRAELVGTGIFKEVIATPGAPLTAAAAQGNLPGLISALRGKTFTAKITSMPEGSSRTFDQIPEFLDGVVQTARSGNPTFDPVWVEEQVRKLLGDLKIEMYDCTEEMWPMKDNNWIRIYYQDSKISSDSWSKGGLFPGATFFDEGEPAITMSDVQWSPTPGPGQPATVALVIKASTTNPNNCVDETYSTFDITLTFN